MFLGAVSEHPPFKYFLGGILFTTAAVVAEKVRQPPPRDHVNFSVVCRPAKPMRQSTPRTPMRKRACCGISRSRRLPRDVDNKRYRLPRGGRRAKMESNDSTLFAIPCHHDTEVSHFYRSQVSNRTRRSRSRPKTSSAEECHQKSRHYGAILQVLSLPAPLRSDRTLRNCLHLNISESTVPTTMSCLRNRNGARRAILQVFVRKRPRSSAQRALDSLNENHLPTTADCCLMPKMSYYVYYKGTGTARDDQQRKFQSLFYLFQHMRSLL